MIDSTLHCVQGRFITPKAKEHTYKCIYDPRLSGAYLETRLSGTYLETNIFVLRVYTRFMKSAAQPTFDPMILWISWFDPHAKAICSG